jgi:hypothetical protein
MYDSGSLAAAVRQAAANLTSAAAAVGRVLESFADALEPDAEMPAAPRPAAATRKAPVSQRTSTARSSRPRKKTATVPAKTQSAPGKRAGRTARGRSSPA